jgi:hypothetical protein
MGIGMVSLTVRRPAGEFLLQLTATVVRSQFGGQGSSCRCHKKSGVPQTRYGLNTKGYEGYSRE